ncbi:hypothetical protein B0T16DRAFT_418715 [Cercophora newfieldiana]|uniref:Uncharacterized protein n=1 Tax=Cercophora newfieldiana TaxID=92897 RepID=A0AA39XWY3_9PEZI|nr:hypothetical protein B0T16DRAFT_418715 [Cercophora newfieldiana]
MTMDPGTENLNTSHGILVAPPPRRCRAVPVRSATQAALSRCSRWPGMPFHSLARSPSAVHSIVPRPHASETAKDRPGDPYQALHPRGIGRSYRAYMRTCLGRQVPACCCVFGVAPQTDSQQRVQQQHDGKGGLRYARGRSHDANGAHT